mmetsp:Transcript_15592/g.30897  ORF Transcript_15592/g.30897 Transcript_15592/m.30897 type:complete len:723 (+) Transcript_15592:115-2283(+)
MKIISQIFFRNYHLVVIAAGQCLYIFGQTVHSATIEQENNFKNVLEKMESDVLALRDEIERVYQYRCNLSTLNSCGYSNYNDCTSSYPNEACVSEDEFVINCGEGMACKASWDITTSKVSIPEALATEAQGNPTDPEIIESVCYTRLAEPYLVTKFERDTYYWSQYNVSPSWSYFGAHNGMFRQIPATHREQCGSYDHRRRPWFVAASSGPKDLVLVLDISGSMNDYGRLNLMKEAAITVIETLSVADKVAVVTFSDDATVLNDEFVLVRATKENKDRLIAAINKINVNGATNFHAAYTKTFDLLEETFKKESTTGCNVAVLFMTDGQLTTGPGPDQVIELVNSKAEEFQTDFRRKMTIFSFSVGQDADEVVSKSIACSTDGIWVPIEENKGSETDIATAMAAYYNLYALGLGEGGNEDFVAWVEPYLFFNRKKMGTTVSVPVYDRSVSPHLFLGVAAVDVYMDALEQIIGEDAASSPMLERFVELSTARCPKIELSERELDALRFLGGGERATCGVSNSTGYAGIVPEKCPFESDWPSQLWANTEKENKSYLERACCPREGSNEVNDSTEVCTIEDVNEDFAAGIYADNNNGDQDTETPNTNSSSAKSSTMIYVIVGASVGGALLLSCFLALIVKRKKNHAKSNKREPLPIRQARSNASTRNNTPTAAIASNQTHLASSNAEEGRATNPHGEVGYESAAELPVAKAVQVSPSAPPINPNYE